MRRSNAGLRILENFRLRVSETGRDVSGDVKRMSHEPSNIPELMKITRIDRNGQRREALLKEYFITASMIALLKRVGEEAAKVAPGRVRRAAEAKVRY